MKKVLIILCIGGLVVGSVSVSAQHPGYEEQLVEFGYQALESAILNSGCKSSSTVNVDGLIVLLSTIDTDESRAILARLTNYYLGSSGVEALVYAISRQGRKILDVLHEELNDQTPCNDDEKCDCHTPDEKKALINRLIEIIESDRPVHYVM